MQHKVIDIEDVVIRFAGDSGDGMQLTGTLFADSGHLRVLFQVCPVFRYT